MAAVKRFRNASHSNMEATSSNNRELDLESTLGALPEELRRQIFGCLEPADLASLAQVSRTFRRQADDNELWQPLYMRRMWSDTEGLTRKSDECWKQAFTRRVRIEKHGSGPAYGREHGTICFMRDGILMRTVAAEKNESACDTGEAGRVVKRKRLYAAANRLAIADAVKHSLETHGMMAADGSSVLAVDIVSPKAESNSCPSKSSSIFDRLLSVTIDMHSAIRQAHAK